MTKNIRLCLFLIVCLFHSTSRAQSGRWVWLKGDSSLYNYGNFGAIGVPDPANNAPYFSGYGHWTDLQGNFWCMAYNGLWKYDPLANAWTFVHPSGSNGVYGTQGLPSPLNFPPGLNAPICWTDADGDFWLFGGTNSSGFSLDALWRYQVATDEWTWMKGYPGVTPGITGEPPAVYGTRHVEDVANTPGSKSGSGDYSDWVIGNNLWLFGGGASVGYLSLKNDLWRYNKATNNWAWEAGEQGLNGTGSYGVRGIAGTANVPPARNSAAGWSDGLQRLFLYSGSTYNSPFNDLWQYDIQAGLWTWLDGHAGPGINGGTDEAYCTADTLLRMRARNGFSVTKGPTACARTYWGFGGNIFQMPLRNSLSNDLWLINADKKSWIKVKGFSAGTPIPYHYGVKGVPDAANLPKGRTRSALWTDKSGNVYLYGGLVPDAAPNPNVPLSSPLNDLWKFIPDSSCIRSGLTSVGKLEPPVVTELCAGDSTLMAIPVGAQVSVSPANGTRIDPAAGYIVFYGGTARSHAVVSLPDNPCMGYDSLTVTITLPPAPHAAFAINPLKAYLNSPVNFINQSTHAVSYAWYEEGRLLGTSEDLVRSFTRAGKHCITLVATNRCGDRDSVNHCLEITGDPLVFVPNAFSPNGDGLNDLFRIEGGNFKLIAFDIYNRYGQRIFNTSNNTKGWDGTFNGKRCDVGTYFYYIRYIEHDNGAEHVLKGDLALLP